MQRNNHHREPKKPIKSKQNTAEVIVRIPLQ